MGFGEQPVIFQRISKENIMETLLSISKNRKKYVAVLATLNGTYQLITALSSSYQVPRCPLEYILPETSIDILPTLYFKNTSLSN